MTDTDIANRLKEIIEKGAPDWFIPAYAEMLEIGAKLDRHLAGHKERSAPWRTIGWSAVGAVVMALLWYLLSQAPAILASKP